jgi:hypothetical protein
MLRALLLLLALWLLAEVGMRRRCDGETLPRRRDGETSQLCRNLRVITIGGGANWSYFV